MLDGMVYPSPEEIAESNAFHEQHLFDSYLAHSEAWRREQCRIMLDIIDTMLKNELHRRIMLSENIHRLANVISR